MDRKQPLPEEYLRVGDVPEYPSGHATLVRVADQHHREFFTCRIDDNGFLRTLEPYRPAYVPRDHEVVEVLG